MYRIGTESKKNVCVRDVTEMIAKFWKEGNRQEKRQKLKELEIEKN